jgi:hypothetical protein
VFEANHRTMLSRIIYTSRACCDEQRIPLLLQAARIANARSEITGALYLANGRFVQYLEGEESAVVALFERIRRDPRHADCCEADRRPISSRVYAGWSMACLPGSGCAGMLMKTLVTQSLQGTVDGALLGAFFYAMARTGECR